MPAWHTIVGGLIFFATLAAIMVRPYRLPEAISALIGALLMLLTGIVSMAQALGTLAGEWNVYAFFLGLMATSAIADRAGVFDAVALQAARWGAGSARRLYLALFCLGTLVTAFLSNDATALILTPVVYTLVTRLRLPPMPYMFACTFIADTASFLLPVSNPINILVVGNASLVPFLRHLLAPALFAIACNAVVFTWYFRDALRLQYDVVCLGCTTEVPGTFRHFTLASLTLIAVGYILASAAGVPIGLVAVAGAGLLLVGAGALHALDWRHIREGISWPLFVFISGMFVLIRGVENLGLTAAFGNELLALSGESTFRAVLIVAGGTALGANLINNVPMALVMRSALASSTLPEDLQPVLSYATILGADLGPNLTTVGSLATILWMLILRRRGLEVSQWEYLKLGLTVVPAMILVGALYIWWQH